MRKMSNTPEKVVFAALLFGAALMLGGITVKKAARQRFVADSVSIERR